MRTTQPACGAQTTAIKHSPAGVLIVKTSLLSGRRRGTHPRLGQHGTVRSARDNEDEEEERLNFWNIAMCSLNQSSNSMVITWRCHESLLDLINLTFLPRDDVCMSVVPLLQGAREERSGINLL